MTTVMKKVTDMEEAENGEVHCNSIKPSLAPHGQRSRADSCGIYKWHQGKHMTIAGRQPKG